MPSGLCKNKKCSPFYDKKFYKERCSLKLVITLIKNNYNKKIFTNKMKKDIYGGLLIPKVC